MRYHANSRNELGSAILSPNFEASDENDGFVCPENLPPLTEIGIHSTETLQITLTKSFLAVLKTLVESFSPSAMEQLGQRESGGEGLVVVNECGRKVTLVLGENRGISWCTRKITSFLQMLLFLQKLCLLALRRASSARSGVWRQKNAQPQVFSLLISYNDNTDSTQ